jgi:hypothetical protein
MTRLPGAPAGPVRKPVPDVYSVLLLIAVIFLVAAITVVTVDLMTSYRLSFGQIFQASPQLPR